MHPVTRHSRTHRGICRATAAGIRIALTSDHGRSTMERCATTRARRARVQLQLHSGAGVRQYRELGAFVRYCVSRIERELGEIDRWSVTLSPAGGEFTSRVAIESADASLESAGRGFDGPLAVWDALCKLEQLLRDARARHSSITVEIAPAHRRLAALNSGGLT
jgi:hypothetical protein